MLEEAVSRQTDRVWAKDHRLQVVGRVCIFAGDVVFHRSHRPCGRGLANLMDASGWFLTGLCG